MNIHKHLILSLVVSCALLTGAFGQATYAVEKVSNRQTSLAPLDPRHSFSFSPAQAQPHAPGRLIVKLRGGTSSKAAFTLRTELRVTVSQELSLIGAQVWQLDGMSVEQAVAQYQDHPDVVYIEPDYIVHIPQPITETVRDFDLSTLAVSNVPNDPLFGELWGMEMIDAPQAWDIQTGSDTVVVGVIDTGIDYTHPDLAAHVWTNPNEIPDNGVDDDGNGYVDDVHGWDFYSDDNDPMDDHGHGTHVAGTIAAVGNNGIGVTGVNWSGSVMALKFLGSDGYGYTSGAVAAIEYATQMGVSLTNNSWGGGEYSQAMYDAIAAAGASGQLFVVAAGNSSHNNDEFPSYPNSYDLDNIIAVAATNNADQKADFSSYGLASTDLGAPGVDILSTLPITSSGCGTGNDDGYGSCSGTSMAAPHVSGVAGLVWSQFPSMNALKVKHHILASVDPLSDLDTITVSGGRLNAYGALTYVGGPVVTPGSLVVALEAGERITRTIMIDSFGDVGTLDWTVDVQASWVQVTPVSGTIPQTSTATLKRPTTVTLTIDTNSLPYGVSDTILTIRPDDPQLSTTRVPIVVKLHMNILDAPQTMLALGDVDDWLGRRIALDGDVALAYSSGGTVGEGTIQVFRWNDTIWTLEDQLLANDPNGTAKFAMAVSDDRILIGDTGDASNGSRAGAAYVYRWNGTTWVEEAKLLASDGQTNDFFGISGSISGDVVVIGAGGSAAYVYRWNGLNWIEEAKLTPDGDDSMGFGDGENSSSISGDTVLVSDWDDNDQGDGAGAAYVYHWDGTNWIQQAKLTAPDGQPEDYFGSAVSIYGDVAVVRGASCCIGTAYVYRWTGDQWHMEEKLMSDDESVNFGYSIDVNDNLIVVGDPNNRDLDGFYVGAVYVYRWNGSNWGEAKIMASDRPSCSPLPGLPPPFGRICDWFGISVAVDQRRVVVGSYAYDQFSGAAFAYDLPLESIPSIGISPANGVVVQIDEGASTTYTLHIENLGTEALTWSLSPVDNVAWLNITPTSGLLLPGANQPVVLTFNDVDRQRATLQTSLIILSNDPFGQRVELPVTLRVGWEDYAYLPLIVK